MVSFIVALCAYFKVLAFSMTLVQRYPGLQVMGNSLWGKAVNALILCWPYVTNYALKSAPFSCDNSGIAYGTPVKQILLCRSGLPARVVFR